MNDKDIVTLPTIVNPVIPGETNAPGSIDTSMISGSYGISTFGYADNFDAIYNFILPFYIDQNVTAILQVYLNLLFQKYRAFSKTSASFNIAAHTHGINGIATDDEGTGSTSHQHGSTIVNKAAFQAEDKEVRVRDLGVTDSEGKNKYQLVTALNIGDTRLSVGFTDTGHHHDITGKTTASGGGETIAATSLNFGIYEAPAYPTNVGIKIDGVDRTTDLGGPWNPTAGAPKVVDLDLTEYITDIGYHTLELSTDDKGRCIPMLWIKTQSKK